MTTSDTNDRDDVIPLPGVDGAALYSVPDAMRLLGGLGRTSFYALVKSGQLRLVKVGGRSFVTATELRRFVQRLEAEAG